MRRGLRLWAVLLAMVLAGAALAQSVQSPVLTIDSERLYRDSAFGQKVLEDIEVRTRALAEENRALESQLEAEERDLTEQRAGMAPEEFRALADAFDARVQAIRRERDAKSRAISELLDQNREEFLQVAAPVLESIMREAGAAVVLEVRSVFSSATAIDITDEAIARIDASLGDGDGPSDQ